MGDNERVIASSNEELCYEILIRFCDCLFDAIFKAPLLLEIPKKSVDFLNEYSQYFNEIDAWFTLETQLKINDYLYEKIGIYISKKVDNVENPFDSFSTESLDWFLDLLEDEYCGHYENEGDCIGIPTCFKMIINKANARLQTFNVFYLSIKDSYQRQNETLASYLDEIDENINSVFLDVDKNNDSTLRMKSELKKTEKKIRYFSKTIREREEKCMKPI